MTLVRHLAPALVAGLFLAVPLSAQDSTGVITGKVVDQMIQGRAAGVDIIQDSGEPGAGRRILIRGGSSIGVGGATNDPLYVVDGVPINNEPTEPQSLGLFGDPMLARNPLNLLNPGDISSITVLKDAAATAIYGSRASNGVILIETKRGQTSGGPSFEYDGYVAASSPTKRYDLLNGTEYRQFVADKVALWRTDSTAFRTRHPGADTIFTSHFKDSSATFNALDPSTVV